MVTGAKVDGGIPTVSAGIRRTIQSIKEIVGSHSDADIYAVLKETNMDPNETTQKLLNQDDGAAQDIVISKCLKYLHPFHEVRRKRTKNKENVGNKGSVEPSKNLQESVNEGTKTNSFDQNHQRGDNYKKGEQSQREGYNLIGGYNQRGGDVVRRGGNISRGDDNQRGDSVHKVDDNLKSGGFQRGDGNQRNSSVQRYDAQRDGGFWRGDGKQRDSVVQRYDARHGDVQRGDVNIRGFGFQGGSGFYRGGDVRRGVSFQRDGYAWNPLPRNPVKGREFRVVRDNRVNQNTSQDSSAMHQRSISNGEEAISDSTTKGDSSEILNNQKVAALSGSSNENVHEPKGSDERRATLHSSNTQRQSGKSKDSRPRSAGQASNNSVLGLYSSSSDPVHVPSLARSSANGSFRREVGVVGVRKMPIDNSRKQSSVNATSTKSNLSGESARPHNVSPKGNQYGQNTATGPVVPIMSSSRPFSANNQYGHRSHQQPAGHQKAVQPSKEWKPKSSQKIAANAEVVRLSSESALRAAEFAADGLKDPNMESGKLPDKHNFRENQGVIIAEHIRVPDIDRCRVIFGSFGLDVNSTDSDAGSQTVGGTGEFGGDLSASMPVAASVASNVDVAVVESPESLTCDAAVEHQFPDTKNNSSPINLESYAEIGMVRSDSPSFAAPELQKQHDAVDMGSFSAYDPQTGYDATYFRRSTDEAAGGGLSSGQDGFNLHVAGMIPASQALYQQQTQIAQMYPQVHVSHYMPYRQFIPPVYVPPMGLPGYSANTAYGHPANGNGYILMPGGSAHLNANAMKYGAQQQFKPAPGGSPAGLGNYTTPNGYTVNAPGGMMGATGIDDPSRLKYKDGSLYVPNSRAEAQEMWIQNPREVSGLQSSQYYGMQGQAPHGTYMPSHVGHHAAFNPAAAAVAQSSHMQFPGPYHPQAQAAAIPNPHHMAPANVGVGVPQAAPMAQVGAYQQPQINHLQWTSNTF